jgi:3-carboxy-cis,cis-muconate cycloisomerase
MSIGIFDHPLLGGVFGDAEVGAFFSLGTELRAMVRVEIALARVEGRLGIIPADAAEAIRELDDFIPDPSILAEGTRASGVIVPPLVTALRRAVGAPHGSYVHWGATTQDIVDTGLVLRLRDVLDILEVRLSVLIDVLADAAERHAELPMAARTRSQVATPTTLGLRIAGWLAPLLRCRDRLVDLRPRLLIVQLGGASGTLGVFGEQGIAVMEGVAAELGLAAPLKPWHSERDGMADLAHWLALVTGALGKMAGDLILTGRSESGEVRAGAGGGSSTMPQKANPVAAEAIVSLARHNAGQVSLAHQALLHAEERDCTAWALEWMALPQMIAATGAALSHAEGLARSIEPDAARMHTMLDDTVLAEAAAFALAQHMPLDEAQVLVRRAAREKGALLDRLALLTDVPVDFASLRNPATVSGSASALVRRVLSEV